MGSAAATAGTYRPVHAPNTRITATVPAEYTRNQVPKAAAANPMSAHHSDTVTTLSARCMVSASGIAAPASMSSRPVIGNGNHSGPTNA